MFWIACLYFGGIAALLAKQWLLGVILLLGPVLQMHGLAWWELPAPEPKPEPWRVPGPGL